MILIKVNRFCLPQFAIGQLLRTLLPTDWSHYDFVCEHLRASFDLIRSWHGLFVMSIQLCRFENDLVWILSCFLLMRQHNNCLWFVLIVSISNWYQTISRWLDYDSIHSILWWHKKHNTSISVGIHWFGSCLVLNDITTSN